MNLAELLKFSRVSKKGWSKFNQRERVMTTKNLAIITNKTKPGALIGIDCTFCNQSYAVTGTTYGIFLISQPNINKLSPMRVSC